MKLTSTPFANADGITKGQIFDVQVEHYGQVRTISFVARYIREDEIILVSTENVAYCSVGGKCWPCELEIWAMTSTGRAKDAQYPARKRIPTVHLASSTNRLNRNYPIAGFWCPAAENNRSEHNSA